VYNLEVESDHTYFVGGEDWGFDVWSHNHNEGGGGAADSGPKKIVINSDRYPESARHLEESGATGRPLTVNREGAPKNRADALRGRPKVPGHDLDEAPPAVLRNPGDPVSVRPLDPSDNRGSGSSIGHQLREVPNGGQVIIEVLKPGGQ
jgi:hypothetical protein